MNHADEREHIPAEIKGTAGGEWRAASYKPVSRGESLCEQCQPSAAEAMPFHRVRQLLIGNADCQLLSA
jgi:hypothetical protein